MSHVLEMLNERDILCNNVVFPWEFNFQNMRLWVIGTKAAPVAAVWASHEQEALDVFVDAGYETFLVKNYVDDESDTVTFAGNASEPQDLSDAHIECVTLDPSDKDDLPWIIKFAEQRGACADNLAGTNASEDRKLRRRVELKARIDKVLADCIRELEALAFYDELNEALYDEICATAYDARKLLTETWSIL